jgi:hypothetical protein
MDFPFLSKEEFAKMGQDIQNMNFKPNDIVNSVVRTIKEDTKLFEAQWASQANTYQTIGPPHDPSGFFKSLDNIATNIGKVDIQSNDQSTTLDGHKSAIQESPWQSWIDTFNNSIASITSPFKNTIDKFNEDVAVTKFLLFMIAALLLFVFSSLKN